MSNQFSHIEYIVQWDKVGGRKFQRVVTVSGVWVASVIDYRQLASFMDQLNAEK